MSIVSEAGASPVELSSSLLADVDALPTDKSVIILQSLLCLLRERNILSRADIEELCDKVQVRAAGRDPLPCCPESGHEAASIMSDLTRYIGQRYGGKHRRN